MKNLCERLNLTTNSKDASSKAVKLNTKRDINYYETLCLYFANNNINLDEISDIDFSACSDLIENYNKNSAAEYDVTYFWID